MAPNRARNQSAARTYKLGAISISYFFHINQEMTMSKYKPITTNRFKNLDKNENNFFLFYSKEKYGLVCIRLAGGEMMK